MRWEDRNSDGDTVFMEAVKCQDREVIRVLLACSAVDINAASERTHSDPSSNFPIIWCLRNKKYQIAMDIYNIIYKNTNIQILTIFNQLPGSDKDKWTSMERLLCPEGCNNTPCVAQLLSSTCTHGYQTTPTFALYKRVITSSRKRVDSNDRSEKLSMDLMRIVERHFYSIDTTK